MRSDVGWRMLAAGHEAGRAVIAWHYKRYVLQHLVSCAACAAALQVKIHK